MKKPIFGFWGWFILCLLNMFALYIKVNTLSVVAVIFCLVNMWIVKIIEDIDRRKKR
ncbi:MAG: hypothetical protein HWN81_00105 [Candidatus Lokiarchaeota archaeon]|nr:hypothetical protein [Candidatus Lokiarchaeota archaeon]